ncbi:MAG: hypothetical protein AB7O80_06030 [Acetobacteraceae bacterium]
MKSLILAAAITLSLGTTAALAENGESFEWAATTPSPSTASTSQVKQTSVTTPDAMSKHNLADNQSVMSFAFTGNG